MAKFRCKKCNHIFGCSIVVKVCPNCGESDYIEEEQNADELLKGA